MCQNLKQEESYVDLGDCFAGSWLDSRRCNRIHCEKQTVSCILCIVNLTLAMLHRTLLLCPQMALSACNIAYRLTIHCRGPSNQAGRSNSHAIDPHCCESPRTEFSDRGSAQFSACNTPPVLRDPSSRHSSIETPLSIRPYNLASGSLVCFHDGDGHLLVAKQSGRQWELRVVPKTNHSGATVLKRHPLKLLHGMHSLI